MGAEAEGNSPTTACRRRARDHGKGAAHLRSAVRQFLLEAVQGPPESVIWFCNFVVQEELLQGEDDAAEVSTPQYFFFHLFCAFPGAM